MHEDNLSYVKNSLSTSRKTQFFSITKVSWLMFYRKMIAIYSDNHKKEIHAMENM
jgi:hypothetical protein